MINASRFLRAANSLVQLSTPRSGVVLLTLANPPRNAISIPMGDAFVKAIDDVKQMGSAVRCVVVTGSPPAFCAGGDLQFLNDRMSFPEDENVREMMTFYKRFTRIRDLYVPSIAAINGAAFGAGLCLTLSCDIRLASAEAKLSFNFTQLGLHPGMAATHLLPTLIGPQRAAHLLLTSAVVSGTEAAAMGLVLKAVSAPEDVVTAALDMAGQIAENSPQAVRCTVETLRSHAGSTLETGLLREASCQSTNYKYKKDLTEGLAAVKEKRKPSFSNLS